MIRDLNINNWFRDNGDSTLRLNYKLDENSIVFDLGGYHGEWSEKIFNKYKCDVHVFEPINSLYVGIIKKFSNNKKIKVYDFGISDVNETRYISLDKDGSSFYTNKENKIQCKVKSIIDFIKTENIQKIDLIKINVEGDEFKILQKIIDENLVDNFNNIQVQFHEFYPNAVNLRLELQEKLKKTHHLTYNYDFVWENWEKNN